MNYELAYKNPLAFYDSVMNQDIVEHKIKSEARNQHTNYSSPTGRFSQKLTKRKVGRILIAVQGKIKDMLVRYDPSLATRDAELNKAMNDPSVRSAIYHNLRRDSIKLVD